MNTVKLMRYKAVIASFAVLLFLIWGCSDTASVETEINDTTSIPESGVTSKGEIESDSEHVAIISSERMDWFDNISENNLTCASPGSNLNIMSFSNGNSLKWSYTDIIEGEIYFSVDRDWDSWNRAIDAKFMPVHSVDNLSSDYDYSWYGTASEYYFVELIDEYGNRLKRISTRLSAKNYPDFAFRDGKILPPDTYGFVAVVANPPKYKSIVLLEIDIDGNEREMASIAKSDNSPKASVIEPTANQIILDDTFKFEWTPSDLDQDYLTYMLWYSTDDGLTYTNLPGEEWIYTTLKSGIFTAVYELRKSDVQKLFGSNTKLAVSVSDGAQSTFVESLTFCVPGINTDAFAGSIDPNPGCLNTEERGENLRTIEGVQMHYISGEVKFNIRDGISNDNILRYDKTISAEFNPLTLIESPPHLFIFPFISGYRLELMNDSGDMVRKIPVRVWGANNSWHAVNLQWPNDKLPFDTWIVDPPEFKSYALYNQDKLLAFVELSEHFPEVEVIEPRACRIIDGNEFEVSWAGSDEDGDTLVYSVEYLFFDEQNGYWVVYTMAENLQNTNLLIKRSEVYHPVSSQSKIRVIVSDGSRSSYAESGIFAVSNSPSVAISSYDEGITYEIADFIGDYIQRLR